MARSNIGVTSFEGRNSPPSHFLFKVESFSSLSKTSVTKLRSNQFEAEGYKWRLVIYPNGNKSRDHISIYLELLETTSLPAGWEVCLTANFFIFNKLQDKYLGKNGGVGLPYHSMSTELGIDRFLDLITFQDPLNGYLFGGTCVFGVELFILKNNYTEGRLSLMKKPTTCSNTWKIEKFSNLSDEEYNSESFGCYKWNVALYPNGHAEGEGNSISIFLQVPSSSIPSNTNLLLSFILRIKDQQNEEHIEFEGENIFGPPGSCSWGFRNFLSLTLLKDPKKGYLVDDTLIIEADVTLVGLVLTKS